MSQDQLKHRIYSYVCSTPSEFSKEDIRTGIGLNDDFSEREFITACDNVLAMLYRNNELCCYNGMYQTI